MPKRFIIVLVIEMYIYYNPNPRGRNVGDCVIRAVAKATGQSWLEAYMSLYVMGMQLGDLANSDPVWTAYLRSKGFIRDVIPDTCPDCYTIADFAADNPTGIYVLGTGSHAVAVVDGDIYDAWDSQNEIPTFYMKRKY